MDSNPSSMIYKPRSSYSWTQNYRWQNGKQYKRKTNRGQSALALHSDLSLSLFFSCMKSSKILTLATLLLNNLPSATHPPLKSAKRFFIAAQQCYLEIKTIKQPNFSILSSIILCSWTTIAVFSSEFSMSMLIQYLLMLLGLKLWSLKKLSTLLNLKSNNKIRWHSNFYKSIDRHI